MAGGSDGSCSGNNEGEWYQELFAQQLQDRLAVQGSATSAARWAQRRVLVSGMLEDDYSGVAGWIAVRAAFANWAVGCGLLDQARGEVPGL